MSTPRKPKWLRRLQVQHYIVILLSIITALGLSVIWPDLILLFLIIAFAITFLNDVWIGWIIENRRTTGLNTGSVLCPYCSYNGIGIPESENTIVCPECGKRFCPAQERQKIKDAWGEFRGER